MAAIKFARVIKGLRMKALNGKRKLSLRAAAERIGISDTYLSHLENGKREPPDPKIISDIAAAYKVNFFELMSCAGYLGPSPGSREERQLREHEDLINTHPDGPEFMQPRLQALGVISEALAHVGAQAMAALPLMNALIKKHVNSREYRIEQFQKDPDCKDIQIGGLAVEAQDALLKMRDLLLREGLARIMKTNELNRRIVELEQQVALRPRRKQKGLGPGQ